MGGVGNTGALLFVADLLVQFFCDAREIRDHGFDFRHLLLSLLDFEAPQPILTLA